MFCHLLSSFAVREEHSATSNLGQGRRGAGEPAMTMRGHAQILHCQLSKGQQDDVVRLASLWGREPLSAGQRRTFRTATSPRSISMEKSSGPIADITQPPPAPARPGPFMFEPVSTQRPSVPLAAGLAAAATVTETMALSRHPSPTATFAERLPGSSSRQRHDAPVNATVSAAEQRSRRGPERREFCGH